MRLLIVGAQDEQINAASVIAKNRGAKVTVAQNTSIALENLRLGRGADLIMIDVRQDIKSFINNLDLEHISVPVVACGVNSDSKAAIDAIKAGAKEYIPLPPDHELIAAMIQSITEESEDLIFSSPSMEKIIKLADQIAPSDANILITGESGTGKEVMARYIHKKSKRQNEPFISVNCAAIPDNLLESEMFGHEKGAFTGAVARRIGKFEEANTGTLLLDEISEMDNRLQAKLLRAIQEREIDRVGGSKPVKLNIRIIATSNRNLIEEAKKGTFREDLLFRLNVFNLHLPPLRERNEDIMPIAEYFAKKYANSNGVQVPKFTDNVIHVLKTYHWPGNVRELENAMHRAVLLATDGKIDNDAVMLLQKDKVQDSSSDGNNALVGRTVDSVEKDLILDTLDHCLGNRTHAANMLGISIRTLRNKLKEYQDAGINVSNSSD